MKLPCLFAASASMFVLAGTASAQSYPTKPVRIIVGNAPGGSNDVLARLHAQHLEKRLGQPFIVENRPGANSTLAAQAVARADPDGYNLLFGNMISVTPIFVKANSVMANKELAPISTLVKIKGVFLYMSSKLPVNSLRELVAYSKANPGKLNFGAAITSMDLLMHLLKDRTGITYTNVPYKGTPMIVTALLAGEIDLTINTSEGFVPHTQAGKIRTLFVFDRARSTVLPDAPSASEVGLPDLTAEFNIDVWAPLRTPKDVIDKLATTSAAIMKTPEVVDQVRRVGGAQPVGATPAETLRAFEQGVAFWSEAARLANFTPPQ